MTPPPLDGAALVVVDMQRAFCEPDGSMARSGSDHRECAAVVPTVARLLAAWRRSGRPVVLARYALAPGGADAGLLAERSPQLQVPGALVDGTRDAEFVDAVSPRQGELVLTKTRFSAFHGTRLEQHLAAHGVATVVLCGVTTNVCVEGTARDAFARDLRVVVAADACASTDPELHDASLRTIAWCMGDVVTTDALAAPAYTAPAHGAA